MLNEHTKEVARGTIEVEFREEKGAIFFFRSKGRNVMTLVEPDHNAKPFTPAAEAMLNPKNKLEEIARRIKEAGYNGRCNISPIELRQAREVIRIMVEELNKFVDHRMFCGAARRLLRARIAKLEGLINDN